jgi:hypothetical protein
MLRSSGEAAVRLWANSLEFLKMANIEQKWRAEKLLPH